MDALKGGDQLTRHPVRRLSTVISLGAKSWKKRVELGRRNSRARRKWRVGWSPRCAPSTGVVGVRHANSAHSSAAVAPHPALAAKPEFRARRNDHTRARARFCCCRCCTPTPQRERGVSSPGPDFWFPRKVVARWWCAPLLRVQNRHEIRVPPALTADRVWRR